MINNNLMNAKQEYDVHNEDEDEVQKPHPNLKSASVREIN